MTGTLVYTLFPFGTAYFLFRNFYRLEYDHDSKRYGDLHEFRSLYGELYAELRSHKRVTASYTILFLLRRVIFALSAVFLTNWPLVQVNLLFLQSLVIILYLIHYKPFEDKSMT